MGLLNL